LLSSMNDLPSEKGKTKQIEVNAETIDRLVEKFLLTALKVIKIDTEGHDIEVLKGAHQTLSSGKVLFLILEFGINSQNLRHVTLSTFLRFLQPYSYMLAEVDGWGIYDGYLYGNALFVQTNSDQM